MTETIDRTEFQNVASGFGLTDREQQALLEELDAQHYRQRLAEAGGRVKELQAMEAELGERKRGPMVEKTFRSVGVEWDDLRPLEKQAAQRWDGDLSDRKAAIKFARENGFPVRAKEKK